MQNSSEFVVNKISELKMGTRTTTPMDAQEKSSPSDTENSCVEKSTVGVQQLLIDMQRLSEDHENADVVFVVDRDEERVHAHKIILMARCKNFQSIHRGEFCRIAGSLVSPSGTPGSPTHIRLPHVNVNVFRQFILYVYTGKLQLHDSRLFEMITLAQDVGLDELKTACEDHVILTLSVTNACTLLMAAMDIQEKTSGAKSMSSFLERCISYIGENASECVKSPSFLSLSKEGIIKLISSDYFCLEEEDVWRCVLAWAKHKAIVNRPTGHWTEEERSRVCQYLSGVMGHVRLLLIDSQVFAEEVEPTGAVPMEVSLERYRHAALQTSKQSVHLPQNGPSALMTQTSILPTAATGASMMAGDNSLAHARPRINPNSTASKLLENDKRLQPRLPMNMFAGSIILKNERINFQGTLNTWYGVAKQNWRLVFRASTHGFSAAAFHRFCDGVAPVYVIAQGSGGEISGGFSDVAWAKTNRKGGYIHSERSFLFALCTGNEPPTKYDIVKKPYAICYHPEVGPIFGAGADLQIANNCNANMDSYSNLPHSYDGGTDASCVSLFGDYNFTVNDYEVYALATVPSPPTNKQKHDRYQ